MSKMEWWKPQAGFFGSGYVIGDNSKEGYIPDKSETVERRTEREVSGLVQLLHLTGSEHILDIPCGYGRHSNALASLGYAVTGIDINPEFLDLAQSQVDKHSPSRFMQGDMRTVGDDHPETFDILINMFYSFGFFSDNQNEQSMHQFYQALRPNGKLLLHTDVSPEMIQHGAYRLEEIRTLEKGALKIQECYDPKSKRIEGTWTLHHAQQEQSLAPYSVRIYSATEFVHLATSVGFQKVAVYGDFKGSEFTAQCSEMIVVAEK